VNDTVNKLAAAAVVPSKNPLVLEQAAVGALTRLGAAAAPATQVDGK
jgi:hypothetical protein